MPEGERMRPTIRFFYFDMNSVLCLRVVVLNEIHDFRLRRGQAGPYSKIESSYF
jgi:hypothetical protein